MELIRQHGPRQQCIKLLLICICHHIIALCFHTLQLRIVRKVVGCRFGKIQPVNPDERIFIDQLPVNIAAGQSRNAFFHKVKLYVSCQKQACFPLIHRQLRHWLLTLHLHRQIQGQIVAVYLRERYGQAV